VSGLNRTAILAAADWLEANPDKHCSGDMAQDNDGRNCNPMSGRAVCFCALGRIAREVNLRMPEEGVSEALTKHVGLTSEQVTSIWMKNDDMSVILHDGKGNPAVIPLLREIAA
jgi:hypothetical protein